MNNARYILLGSIGIAALLLMATDPGKKLRNNIGTEAKKLKKRLSGFGEEATAKLDDLKDMLSDEVEGLSDDARKRIEAILNDTAKATGKLKAKASRQLM